MEKQRYEFWAYPVGTKGFVAVKHTVVKSKCECCGMRTMGDEYQPVAVAVIWNPSYEGENVYYEVGDDAGERHTVDDACFHLTREEAQAECDRLNGGK